MALLCFLLGMLSVYFIIPCLESLAELIVLWIEAKKVVQTEMINDSNLRMTEKSKELDGLKIVVPGFAPPEEKAKDEEKI